MKIIEIHIKNVLESIHDEIVFCSSNDDCEDLMDNRIKLGDAINIINKYLITLTKEGENE